MPKNMTQEDIADVFNTYLIGVSARRYNQPLHGPHFEKKSPKWLLDSHNDYWLRMGDEPGTVVVSCRYSGQQEKTLEAMVALFEARYGKYSY